MTYCKQNKSGDSFSGMELLRQSAFVGYGFVVLMTSSATMPPKVIHAKAEAVCACSYSIGSRSELSVFLFKHTEEAFKSIWNNPAEDVWDAL